MPEAPPVVADAGPLIILLARGYFLARSVVDRAISEAGEGALH